MVQVTINDVKTGGYYLTLMTGFNDNLDLNGGATYEVLLSKLHNIEKQLNGLISKIRNQR